MQYRKFVPSTEMFPENINIHIISKEEMRRNINQAVDDMYLIEKRWHRRIPTLSRWNGYHMATNGRWYYAYTIDGDTITIQDACHAQNMHED